MSKHLDAWIHWKRLEKNLSEDDLQFVSDIERLIKRTKQLEQIILKQDKALEFYGRSMGFRARCDYYNSWFISKCERIVKENYIKKYTLKKENKMKYLIYIIIIAAILGLLYYFLDSTGILAGLFGIGLAGQQIANKYKANHEKLLNEENKIKEDLKNLDEKEKNIKDNLKDLTPEEEKDYWKNQ